MALTGTDTSFCAEGRDPSTAFPFANANGSFAQDDKIEKFSGVSKSKYPATEIEFPQKR
jgi:hypothetical protein